MSTISLESKVREDVVLMGPLLTLAEDTSNIASAAIAKVRTDLDGEAVPSLGGTVGVLDGRALVSTDNQIIRVLYSGGEDKLFDVCRNRPLLHRFSLPYNSGTRVTTGRLLARLPVFNRDASSNVIYIKAADVPNPELSGTIYAWGGQVFYFIPRFNGVSLAIPVMVVTVDRDYLPAMYFSVLNTKVRGRGKIPNIPREAVKIELNTALPDVIKLTVVDQIKEDLEKMGLMDLVEEREVLITDYYHVTPQTLKGTFVDKLLTKIDDKWKKEPGSRASMGETVGHISEDFGTSVDSNVPF